MPGDHRSRRQFLGGIGVEKRISPVGDVVAGAVRDVERQLHGVALTVVDVQIVVRLGQHDVPRIGTHLVDVAVVDRHTLREGQLHVLGQIAHVAVQRAVVERQRPVVFEVADFVVFEQKRAQVTL